MNSSSHIDMYEVTRLTREGRLAEAMALLRGDAVAAGTTPPVPQASTRRTIDLPPAAPESYDPTAAMRDLLGRLAGMDLMGLGQSEQALPAAVPLDGARFENRTFANPAGSRDYKLYVPSTYSGQPLPLIIMLHGCTQSPDDFAAGTRMNEVAEELNFLVAYPAQAKSANASKCWNWFNAEDQKRDRGEPSLIAGIAREIMAAFPVPADRVFIAGLSAGGAAAAVMGATYPDLFSAVGVHSGLPCGAASDMASAFGAMRDGSNQARHPSSTVRTIVFHGDRDTTVNPINGDQVIAQSRGDEDLRSVTTRGRSPDGARFTRTVESDAEGRAVLEHWILHDLGHAWSGGDTAGSYTEPHGPDASREMARFFLDVGAT